MGSTSSPLRRVVTTHKGCQSSILFDSELDPIPGFASNAVTIWKTSSYPAELASHDPCNDPSARKMYARGSLIRVVDFPPNSTGHNHRTQSLDYAIVLNGEIDLVLDDGSRTRIQQGDVVVQQAVGYAGPCLLSKRCADSYNRRCTSGIILRENTHALYLFYSLLSRL